MATITDPQLINGVELSETPDDKYFLKVTGKGIDEESQVNAYNNTLRGGDGNSKFDIFAKHSGNAYIFGNEIIANDGADSLKIRSTSTRGPASVFSNDISLDGGKNKVQIDAKSNTTDGFTSSLIFTNTITSGDSDAIASTVNLNAISKSNSNIFRNDITTGNGADKLTISAKSGHESATVRENTIEAGDGENKITFQANLTGKEGEAELKENDVSTGSDDDDISFSAKAKEDALLLENTISGGDGHDEVSLVANTKVLASIQSNYLEGGNGEDEISLLSKSKAQGEIDQNTLLGGYGDDYLSVEIKGDTTFLGTATSGNQIDGGDGDDEISVSLNAKTYIGFYGNTIEGGEGNDTIEIDLDAKSRHSTQSSYNLISGGLGDDTFVLDLKTDSSTMDIQDFLENNTIAGGEGANDTLEILSKKQFINLTQVSEGNLSDLEMIDLGKSKSTLYLDDDSVVAATDANNLLLISGKGSSVDLNGGVFIEEVNGFSYFDLGTSMIGLGTGVESIEVMDI